MKKVIIFLTLSIVFIPLYSQSNTVVDQVLTQEFIDFDKGVYMILSAGGKIAEDITPAQALVELDKLKWDIDIKQATDKMTLIDASLLIMNSLEIKGGIMYSIIPIKRYAYKEMIFNNLIENTTDKNRLISGLELLTILGNSLEFKGEVIYE